MAVNLDNQDVMLDDQNRGNPTKPGTGVYDLLDEQSKGNPEKKPEKEEKTWQELFGQTYNQTPELSGVYSPYSPEGIVQPWSTEKTEVPEAAEYTSETGEVPQTMYYGTEPTEVVPENWEETPWWGLFPNVRKGTSYGTEPSEVLPEGYESQIGKAIEYGERPEVVDQLAGTGVLEWVRKLSPETQQLIAEYLAPTSYASAEEVLSAPEIFSAPGTTPTFDENGVRSNALTYDSYLNYLSGVDDLRQIYGDATKTGGTNWKNMIWGMHDQPYLPEDPNGIAAGYGGKIKAEEMKQRQARTQQQFDEATKNIGTLEKERDEQIANYNPDDLSMVLPNKTNAQAEEELVKYLNEQLGPMRARQKAGTGVTDLLTEEMLGNPEDKTITTVGYDGATTTDYGDPGGDLAKAASGQASGEFSLGQNPIQGKLAQAFYDKVNGNPEAEDYYTSVQTEIFENYANIWAETYGTKLPFTDLLDFMLNASGEDAWEFAQFAHSVFGMYSSYEGEDGSVDYSKFMQFYNNCKIYNTIDKLFNAEGQLVRTVVDVFGNDYDLAELTADWLYKNGYTPQGKMDPAQLYAMAIAVMPDMGSDFYEANYNMMGDPTKVGGYVQGGDYSAQGRLPYTVWDYYDPEDISKLETAIGDNSIQYRDFPQLIDSIVFSKGYGWDTSNPGSENTSTNWHSRSNAYKPEEGEE